MGGAWIEEHCDNILFVGRITHMDEDINHIVDLLKLPAVKHVPHIHPGQKFPIGRHAQRPLSELAIHNLFKWYKGDFLAIRAMARCGATKTRERPWLTTEDLAAFAQYNGTRYITDWN